MADIPDGDNGAEPDMGGDTVQHCPHSSLVMYNDNTNLGTVVMMAKIVIMINIICACLAFSQDVGDSAVTQLGIQRH